MHAYLPSPIVYNFTCFFHPLCALFVRHAQCHCDSLRKSRCIPWVNMNSRFKQLGSTSVLGQHQNTRMFRLAGHVLIANQIKTIPNGRHDANICNGVECVQSGFVKRSVKILDRSPGQSTLLAEVSLLKETKIQLSWRCNLPWLPLILPPSSSTSLRRI